MAVTTTSTLVIPAVFGSSGSLNTSATSGSGLTVGTLVDLTDASNEVIGLLTAVASTSIAFSVLEVRQGAVGNTLASGAKVQQGYVSSAAILKSTDIDWTTYGAGKILSATVSNSLPFSFIANPVSGSVAGAAGAESLTIGNNVLKRGTKTVVPADGASDLTVTFGAAFATSVDNIQLTIRSHTSATLKVLTPTPNTIAAGSFKIHIEGGDASSTASVDWLVLGH